jgi:hypothetical protein
MRKFAILALLLILSIPAIGANAQLGDVLTFGTPVTGTIARDALERRYIFNAGGGEIILARMNAIAPGLDTYLTLLDPAGVQIAVDDDGGGGRNSLLGPVRISTPGAYILVASSCCPGTIEPSTGDYSLVLTTLEPQSLSISTQAVFELPAPESVAAYTLEVQGPQLLLMDVSSLQGSGSIILNAFDSQNQQRTYDVRGTDPNSLYYPSLPAYFPESGSYIISIRRDPNMITDSAGSPVSGITGGTIIVQSIPIAPYQLNTPQNGILDDATPYLAFTFNADPNALLALSGSTATPESDFELLMYSPDGSISYSASSAYSMNDAFAIDPLQLVAGGQYVIFIQRTSATGASVAGSTSVYSFTLAGSGIGTLVLGQAVSGTIDETTYERVYRLDGTAGQRLRFTISPVNDTFAPSVFIQGPELGNPSGTSLSGSAVFNASMSSAVSATFSYEVTLPVSGVYLVRVNNGIYNPQGTLLAGDFTLLVESASG